MGIQLLQRVSTVALSLVALSGTCLAQAGYTSSLGVENTFVAPAGWTAGDLQSTYNEWDNKAAGAGNLADQGSLTNPAGLTAATHDVKSPGFRSGTGSFYSFSGNYGATADIYNHGGASGLGTHVIIQTGSTQNHTYAGHTPLVAGHGFGNLADSMKIVALDGSPITGGDNASALQINEVSYRSGLPTSFGPADYQEVIYEFWLANYTSDFRVDWDQIVHGTVDTLRVDSMVAAQSFATTPIPEPASLALLAMGSLAMLSRRRSH